MDGRVRDSSSLSRTFILTWCLQRWSYASLQMVAERSTHASSTGSSHPFISLHSTDMNLLHSLSALGVYQEGMAKNRIDDKKVQAHIYEYTTQLSIDPELKFKGLEKGIVPVGLRSVEWRMSELTLGLG